jgi:hypothetical protein
MVYVVNKIWQKGCRVTSEIVKAAIWSVSLFFSWITHCGQTQVPCSEDTQTAQWTECAPWPKFIYQNPDHNVMVLKVVSLGGK